MGLKAGLPGMGLKAGRLKASSKAGLGLQDQELVGVCCPAFKVLPKPKPLNPTWELPKIGDPKTVP